MSTTIDARERRTSGLPWHPEGTAALFGVLIGAAAGALVGTLAFAGWLWIFVFSAIGAVLGVGATLLQKNMSKRESKRDSLLD